MIHDVVKAVRGITVTDTSAGLTVGRDFDEEFVNRIARATEMRAYVRKKCVEGDVGVRQNF